MNFGDKVDKRKDFGEFKEGDKVWVHRTKHSSYKGPAEINKIKANKCTVRAICLNEEDDGCIFEIEKPGDIKLATDLKIETESDSDIYKSILRQLEENTAKLVENARKTALTEIRAEIVAQIEKNSSPLRTAHGALLDMLNFVNEKFDE